MRPFVSALVALAGTLVLTNAVSQEQVRFTGNTTADETLIHDAFQNIALYVRDSLQCQNIELVEAEVLPEGSVKRDIAQPEGNGPATFEQWTVTFCGKKQRFMIVFWEAKEGGTIYRIELRPGADS